MNKCYCGNEELEEYSTGYYKCGKCNILVSKHDYADSIYTVTSESEDLYGKNYWEQVMVEEAQVEGIDQLIDLYIPERATSWLKSCLKYMKWGTKVADVGCGLGQFSYLLKMVGFDVTAFELSQEICKLIETKLKIKTLCGELSVSDEKYNAIVAMDVFEHLLYPEQFLEQCAERMTDEGILVMQMPNYDPDLSYAEMQREKPRFEHLLVEDQHAYLYSKTAIEKLLRRFGFNDVLYEPAFFGDDYDMFLFASKSPLSENSGEEIEQYLNSVPSGRLVKAMISLFDEKNRKTKECEAIDNERKKILKDVETLTRLVDEKEKQTDKFRDAADERLASMERMAAENKMFQQAADERLASMERMAAENKMLQQAADERLSDVERLLAENKVLQQAADERLSDVERLLAENKILQQAADERLAIIEKMTHAEESK